MKPQTSSRRKAGVLVSCLALGSALDATALDAAALIPPGHFVNLDTHRLYVDCRGQGSPRVLIDYGVAGAAVEWSGVQRDLAGDTTVCTYDRAGYGWSDAGPSPRTAAQAAAEIARLVAIEGWQEPLVLVGHSFGGFDVRYAAATRAVDVAGLVLLESSLAEAGIGRAAPDARGGSRHPLEVARFEVEPAGEDFAVARYLNSRRKAVFTQMDELGHFAQSAAQVTAAGALPAVPLLVVSRDPLQGLADTGAEARWQAGQRDLAASTGLGEWWTASASGHEIHRDRPDLVVAAVRHVLSRIRNGAPRP